MITKADINDRVVEWGLPDSTVEKDYVLGWLLWGIGSDPELAAKWIFKGGTCLKKCFIETYRFSEDLDFTVIDGGPVAPEAVTAAMNRVMARVSEESGIRLGAEPTKFDKKSSAEQSKATLYYFGPREAPNVASIKLDLTAREKPVRPAVERQVSHPYPDEPDPPVAVSCYSFEELFAEKIRAMGERARPRDLYDIINLFRRPEFRREPKVLRELLIAKCANKGIATITFDTVNKPEIVEEVKATWRDMLGHQLPVLPPFEDFWNELPELFRWLESKTAPPPLQSIQTGPSEDRTWSPPATIRVWNSSIPIETVRYAASNHLVVSIGYVKEDGSFSMREIEPYSLRRTSEGKIILHAWDLARNNHRGFRLDRIRSVNVTAKSFRPRYAVELATTGIYTVPSSEHRHSHGPARNMLTRRSSFGGMTYKVQCVVCGRRFSRSSYSTALNPHKDKSGYPCAGRTGFQVF